MFREVIDFIIEPVKILLFLLKGKRKHSLMTWLSTCFFSFTIIMVITLWLFQGVFLESFYKAIKTKNLTSCAESICLNFDNKNIYRLIETICEQNDFCVSLCNHDIYGNYKQYYISNPEVGRQIDSLNSRVLNDYYIKTRNNHGKYIDIIDTDIEEDSLFKDNHFLGEEPELEKKNNKGMVYAVSFTDSDKTEILMLIYSAVTLSSSTKQTLTYQLRIITAVFILIAVFVSVSFSRLLAMPIENINNTAKELAQGNYDIKFSGKGYREVEQLSETLNIATYELSQVDQMRKDLIANVSHDLRTPLTLITGYGEVMRDIPGENTAENIQIIIDEATRLTSLVNDLIDISKIEAGTMKLEASAFCITDTIQAMFGRYNKLKEQDGYSFTLEHDQDVYVYADQLKISQVIYNLVNNAVNYCGDSKAITVRQICYDNRVRIEVIDNGPGIPQDKLKNIWDRYYKVDKSHKSAKIGTGLGLSIVKTILKLHKANFGVFSTVGKGTTFWFELARTNKDGEPL